jgi:hypothetical protein
LEEATDCRSTEVVVVAAAAEVVMMMSIASRF